MQACQRQLPRPRPRRLPAWLAAVLAALPAGCTTVVIHGDGAVKTESHFGIVHLTVEPSRASAVSLASFGAVSLPGSFALGYTRWQGVGIGRSDDDSCLLVTFDSAQPPGAKE